MGNILVTTDNIVLGATGAIDSAGNVTVMPKTGNATIGISNDSETLNLDSTTLGDITATTLTVGNGTNSGLITVSTTDTSAENYGMTINGTGGGGAERQPDSRRESHA